MPAKGPQINRLAYAEDIIIFSVGNNKTIRLIMEQIHKYEMASGQKLNANKSFFIAAPNTKVGRINRIRNATRFMDKQFPINYLGCPIYVGRKKICYFEEMVAKIVKRISGWQGRLLSYGGKVVIIKNVLQSLPLYTLSAMSPPKATLNLIEKHFSRFLWGSSGDKNKFHWSSWKNLCVPKEEGGIGIRRMEDINEICSIKRWWRFRTCPYLWVEYLRARYCVEPIQVRKLLPQATLILGKLFFMRETKRKRIFFGILTQATAVFGGTIGQVKDHLLKWSITLTPPVRFKFPIF
ncbi:PREDICTED: uncharacterized protein LOC109213823 [Nicotiana attenuata]|uniref:uncharacterized protein LOC109213823 n=1 Tax=Nicotiana attenuata TaxID=49451 RepID=UPI0009050A53|nr:PREDICTED: uncharacterized protein LOC109213823 [Nicotiana attenuata]